MGRKQVWLTLVFGSMLAITGCGGDGGGSSASGESSDSGRNPGAGSDLSQVCEAICRNCSRAETDCREDCEQAFDQNTSYDFTACPDELDALNSCVEGVDSCVVFGNECGLQYSTWWGCVINASF